jgi:short-subunit dehydrogenase
LFAVSLFLDLQFLVDVKNPSEVQTMAPLNHQGVKLHRQSTGRRVQQPNNVEESRRNFLGNNDRAVIIGRVRWRSMSQYSMSG